MSKPNAKDLEELVTANIITPETAQQIVAYYEAKKNTPSNKFTIVLGILGAILVGSGIILLIAHNWDDLSKTTKTILAFLPLAITQALAIYTMVRKNDNRTWQEISATLLFFAVPASISMISQLYHIDGSMSSFLLTWALLTLPLVYLLSSGVVSLFSIALSTWYACVAGFDYGHYYPWLYVALIGAIVPHYYRYATRYRNSAFFHLHNWVLVASVSVALCAFITEHADDGWSFAAYMALFSVLYGIGRSRYAQGQGLMANPFLFVGAGGILVILFSWTYLFLWRYSSYGNFNSSFYYRPAFYIILLLLGAAIGLIVRNYKDNKQFDPVAYSSLLFAILMAFTRNDAAVNIFAINVWIVTIGIYFIRKGSLQNHLGILNFGLIITAILALLRFFDDDIPFIWRGIFFVAAGAGFFVANYLLLQKRKSLAKNSGI